MAEQQRELWALKAINEAPEWYRRQCTHQLINFVYWLSKSEMSDLERGQHSTASRRREGFDTLAD